MISTTKPRRSVALEGLKLLIGTGSMAATIGLWSLFANRDFVNQLTQPDPSANSAQASEVNLDLPPIPTLVPIQVQSVNSGSPTAELTTADSQNLRTVSAPSQTSSSGTVPAPRVVRNTGGGGGGGGGGTVTTTRSS